MYKFITMGKYANFNVDSIIKYKYNHSFVCNDRDLHEVNNFPGVDCAC